MGNLMSGSSKHLFLGSVPWIKSKLCVGASLKSSNNSVVSLSFLSTLSQSLLCNKNQLHTISTNTLATADVDKP